MELAIYFLGIADKLETVLFIASLISGLITVIICVFICGEMTTSGYDDDVKRLVRWFRNMLFAVIATIVLLVVIPNSKTLAAMYLIPAISQNEQIQNITGNSLKALEQLTQKWVQDLMPKDEQCKK